jgi:2-polyprenyl-3-methyl-5-hydroxy-6-metoxy-1,4-benzoquinol methylase
MPATETADYDARWGYRQFDARRYERRRYGSFTRRMNLRILQRAIARELRNIGGRRLVLDVPCGTGIVSEHLHAEGFKLVSADISPAMIELARERGGIGHMLADLEVPPFRPGTFDAVLCARFLMHLPPEARPRVLRTLASLTKGPLVATMCHPYTVKTFGRAVRRFFGGKAKESPRLTRRELEAEVAAAGLRLDRVVTVLPLLSEVWVVVIGNPAATH